MRFADGGVRCWGDGSNGKLGQANTDSIGDDEYVLHIDDHDLGGPAVDITAGGHYTCALLADGGVRCWGLGFTGALGYGNAAMIGDDEAPSTAGGVQVF